MKFDSPKMESKTLSVRSTAAKTGRLGNGAKKQNIALMSLHQLEAGHCFALWFGVRSQLQHAVLGRISLPQLLKSKTASETLPC